MADSLTAEGPPVALYYGVASRSTAACLPELERIAARQSRLKLIPLFADRGERATTQALLMLSVTLVVTFSLLLLSFFDNPYGSGLGQLRPIAMERTVRLIDEEIAVADVDVAIPCDDLGARI